MKKYIKERKPTHENFNHNKVTNTAWRAVTEVMRKLQPDCIMMGPDTWVPGNETGRVSFSLGFFMLSQRP